jgi:hypothetical protein
LQVSGSRRISRDDAVTVAFPVLPQEQEQSSWFIKLPAADAPGAPAGRGDLAVSKTQLWAGCALAADELE